MLTGLVGSLEGQSVVDDYLSRLVNYILEVRLSEVNR
jgi:hypothetical protein